VGELGRRSFQPLSKVDAGVQGCASALTFFLWRPHASGYVARFGPGALPGAPFLTGAAGARISSRAHVAHPAVLDHVGDLGVQEGHPAGLWLHR